MTKVYYEVLWVLLTEVTGPESGPALLSHPVKLGSGT